MPLEVATRTLSLIAAPVQSIEMVLVAVVVVVVVAAAAAAAVVVMVGGFAIDFADCLSMEYHHGPYPIRFRPVGLPPVPTVPRLDLARAAFVAAADVVVVVDGAVVLVPVRFDAAVVPVVEDLLAVIVIVVVVVPVAVVVAVAGSVVDSSW